MTPLGRHVKLLRHEQPNGVPFLRMAERGFEVGLEVGFVLFERGGGLLFEFGGGVLEVRGGIFDGGEEREEFLLARIGGVH